MCLSLGWRISRDWSRLEVALPSIKRSSSSSTQHSQSSRWEVEESSAGWKWHCLRSRWALHLPLNAHRAPGEKFRNHPQVGSGAAFHQEELFIFHSTLTELQVRSWGINRKLEVALPSIKRSSSSSTQHSQSSRWEVEESFTGWKWRCLQSRGTLHLPLSAHRALGH